MIKPILLFSAVAFNGSEALETILLELQNKVFFDVVIMDCNMPIMDGFEATKRILAMIEKGEIPWVPVIASTANTSHLDLQKCLKHGMSAYLSKPFTRNDLRNKINWCLKLKAN